MHRYVSDYALRVRADKVLAGGATTLSKGADRFPPYHPQFIVRGQGCYVWDASGNRYVEFMSALGPIILGHNHPKVTEAVTKQITEGVLFSLDHPVTITVAEQLRDLLPSAEMVRFVMSGNDATLAAIRVARVYTGRPKIATTGFHGHGAEWQCIEDERGRAGVPESLRQTTIPFEYNDVDSLSAVFDAHPNEIAAVILEPARTFIPNPGYLEGVKALCEKRGAVLIFDEVVTAFRFPGLSAQAHYGVTPHLTCLGKGTANGFPFGAVVGQADVMRCFDLCFVSGTYFGNTASLAAASATLDILRTEPVVQHIWRQGRRLQDTINDYAGAFGLPVWATGVPCCMRQTWDSGDAAQDKILQDLWLQETARLGQLFGSIQYVNYSHTNEVLNETLSVVGDAMAVVEKAWKSGDLERYLVKEGASLSG